MVTGGGAEQERFRRLAGEAFAPARRPAVPDLLGPIYRRVPGARVVPHDEPTRADLAALLVGSVPAERAAATWRLVEAVVARAAAGATTVPDVDLPPGLLTATGLPVPAAPGLTVGWCTSEQAQRVPALRTWLDASAGPADAASRGGRTWSEVVCFLDGRA